jgi:hypothetical protein
LIPFILVNNCLKAFSRPAFRFRVDPERKKSIAPEMRNTLHYALQSRQQTGLPNSI